MSCNSSEYDLCSILILNLKTRAALGMRSRSSSRHRWKLLILNSPPSQPSTSGISLLSCCVKLRMNDVLQSICLRVDDETLRKMSSSSFWWPRIKKFLFDNNFWYLRVQYLVDRQDLKLRPEADWKRVYYSIKERMENEGVRFEKLSSDSLSQIYGLDNINTLLVIEEIYGWPLWVSEDPIWIAISSPEVLDYLVSSGRLNTGWALDALSSAAKLGRIQMIEPLLALIPKNKKRREAEETVLLVAVTSGQSAVVELVLEMGHISVDTRIEALTSACERQGDEATIRLLIPELPLAVLEQEMGEASMRNNVTALRVLMETLQPSLDDKKALFKNTYSSDAEETLLFLLQDDVRVINPTAFDRLLEDSIRGKHRKLVVFALQHVEPTFATLKLATSDPETFEIVLGKISIPFSSQVVKEIMNESRYATSANRGMFSKIEGTLMFESSDSISIRHTGMKVDNKDINRERVTDILVRDPRVKIEKLFDLPTLRLLAWSLSIHTRDRVRGFILGRELAGGQALGRYELGLEVEKDGMYGMLLRYIILKRPSNVELLDWMIDQHTSLFSVAAERVLSDSLSLESESAPIEALLLIVLYLTLTLRELIVDLRTKNVNEREVVQAAQLVGAWLGEEKIVLSL